ncbi:nitrate reductase molybdenum cofactor assembly chaperone [Candidimonas nitroreducens]|uniref:Nitrate reductase molybdenum cofactor assembly chaperone n=1 Tax=Candidimonas nitroreducens TaxID=683354 RepID=A0A225N3C6_9BURK|nr:nitrate reductase molybdenum cofactor assembly chaperone [Candidimonas nitroreducens]OWT66371.1 nitrate reductase molybdenum cofactor assembly chaperone [Candidimonas nitroreducens]
MSRNPTLLLRALSALLAYPDAELRAALPEIVEAIRDSRALDAQHKGQLIALADEISNSGALDAESRYVELFDHGRRTSLNLFEHVHGDGRERGSAMVALRERYLAAGMEPASNELPDHLPLLLEYLSCRDLAETKDTIGEIAHILRQLGNTLLALNSRYAAVMAALLALGREKGLDTHAAAPPPEDLDAAWEEQPAFAPPAPKPAAQPITFHPRRPQSVNPSRSTILPEVPQ